MKQICAAALIALLATPSLAETVRPRPLDSQETERAEPRDDGDMEEGFNLVEKGLTLFFKGLAEEMEPALQDMAREMEPALKRLAEELGPVLADLSEMIDEIDRYHPPEKLPNGDIILRRKTENDPAPDGPLEKFYPRPIDPDGEIEL